MFVYKHIEGAYLMYPNLLEMLKERAQIYPDRQAYVYLKDGEIETENITYSELEEQVTEIAAYLQMLDIKGERVLLLLPSGIEYILIFFACLYAGVIPVPVYPPSKSRNVERLISIYEDAEPALIILPLHTITNKLPEVMQHTQIMNIEDMKHHQFTYQSLHQDISPDDITFLQYTSGSTSNPKGVIVTHRNLIHNFEIMAYEFQHSENTRMMTWLPFYHDMGLIGNILQNVYNGGTCYIMNSFDFIQNPVRWLKAITKYRITYSGGPDFSYRLCSQKITSAEKQTLDLSTWSHAYSGSEPIHAETIHNFHEQFQTCGFQAKAMQPGYGLAEFTLCATVSSLNTGPRFLNISSTALQQNEVYIVAEKDVVEHSTHVSCGKISPFLSIKIVNPATHMSCNNQQVGEIWLKGDSVTAGYWNDETKSNSTFNASLIDTQESHFLRTGDLGFIADEELYITGRIKDVMIIRGQNYYPQDIERVIAAAHPEINEMNVAAFSIEDNGSEELIIVLEMNREYKHIIRKQQLDLEIEVQRIAQIVRAHVLESMQINAWDVQIIQPLSIPKTSSNKIQRNKCKEMYMNSTLNTWGGLRGKAIQTRV